MARLTVFGAGAMGTALAMHAARAGVDTALWGNPFDQQALDSIREHGRHPALSEHLPTSLAVHGPDELHEAAAGVEIAVLSATSDTARSLAGMVRHAVGGARFLVSLAKGIESRTGSRISEVFAEELPGPAYVAVAGPCLASELAAGAPFDGRVGLRVGGRRPDGGRTPSTRPPTSSRSPTTWPASNTARRPRTSPRSGCRASWTAWASSPTTTFRNAKAALFTKAIQEVCDLVDALGGRRETAMGLAGVGDILVTGTGGRNRLYGELIGEGQDPDEAREHLEARGMASRRPGIAAATPFSALEAVTCQPLRRSSSAAFPMINGTPAKASISTSL